MSTEAIKTVLPNGLMIHLKEIHSAPIISHWVWYRVGSRNEVPGLTGISHWVEHMQFKGTPALPAGVLDKSISREGGYWNAFTYLDWTAYFETMPADKIDLALRLEADRMVNSTYDPKEVESERTVIISEREGSENEPLFRLGEVVQTTAFDRHSYRHEIVGLKEDLLTIRRDDLYQHYRRNYAPNRAVVAVAGDFDAKAMLARLKDLYQDIPAPEPATLSIQPEPKMKGERRQVVEGPGRTTYVQLAYHSPGAATADFFAMTVVDSLLTGPTSLNMFGGGGISNKTSRLYRALVERELAVGVSGGLQATIDPFLYDITLTVHPRQTADKALAALEGEIKRLQDEPVSASEIARAVKQARALFAYGSENITNQAFWLGYSEMFADYQWFVKYVELLDQVTPADVQRIAQTYLSVDNRVVGIYLPNGEEPEEVPA
jgi:zinc protease